MKYSRRCSRHTGQGLSLITSCERRDDRGIVRPEAPREMALVLRRRQHVADNAGRALSIRDGHVALRQSLTRRGASV